MGVRVGGEWALRPVGPYISAGGDWRECWRGFDRIKLNNRTILKPRLLKLNAFVVRTSAKTDLVAKFVHNLFNNGTGGPNRSSHPTGPRPAVRSTNNAFFLSPSSTGDFNGVRCVHASGAIHHAFTGGQNRARRGRDVEAVSTLRTVGLRRGNLPGPGTVPARPAIGSADTASFDHHGMSAGLSVFHGVTGSVGG